MKIIAVPLFLSLIYMTNGLGALGGVNEVSDLVERKSFANKALDQLEKASNNINARKIVEVIRGPTKIVSLCNFVLITIKCIYLP